MGKSYITQSLETHLFFARIMKEHSLFLMAGFPGKNEDCIEKADWFRKQFEELLNEVVELSDGRVSSDVLESCELVTNHTMKAEKQTSFLTGIEIDCETTQKQLNMASDADSKSGDCDSKSEERNRAERNRAERNSAERNSAERNTAERNSTEKSKTRSTNERNRNGCRNCSGNNYNNRADNRNARARNMANNQEKNNISRINRKALQLIEGLIEFKEDVLKKVCEGCLFTANYPLLIEHIKREAKMYCSIVKELEQRGTISNQRMADIEIFWNQIMMEHALFIRGLLDPCEEELICKAHEYALDYKELLEESKRKDCMVNEDLQRRTYEKTVEYRDFKDAGTVGITECKISSIIVPLLADHVLREANHYLRLLDE